MIEGTPQKEEYSLGLDIGPRGIESIGGFLEGIGAGLGNKAEKEGCKVRAVEAVEEEPV